MSPRPPFVRVRWNDRLHATEVLLVNADSTVTHITTGADQDLVEHLKAQYPVLPFDVRPGAFGYRTHTEEET